jgi:8-amino-7-oxononanoate synthase
VSPLPGAWADRVADRLGEIRDGGRWRTVRSLDGGRPRTRVSATGAEIVSFASNDYLGLSQHPAVVAAAHAALDRYGTGAGAARLIVGGRPVHDELERALAAWKDTEAALLFSTGYQANVGVLGALAAAAPGCVVHSDELNHASIIDGARLSRADVCVFPHRDVGALDAALDAHADRPQLVVSDEVFSMDGDLADVAGLADVCRAHGALLVLDVAHSVLASDAPADAVVVGTLSKALGSLGGFVAGPTDVIDLCRNAARSFIFTTATTPADAAAALAAVGVVASAEGDRLRATLRERIDLLAPGHPSPVVPVLLGPEAAAVEAAEALLADGLLVPAIRPPTVAPGTSRLRIAISAAHEPADVLRLANTLVALGLRTSSDPTGAR